MAVFRQDPLTERVWGVIT